MFLQDVISIHAPRERSDFGEQTDEFRKMLFQSTLLVRGATFEWCAAHAQFQISIHAPRERSDFAPTVNDTPFNLISIHAPRERSDT